MNKIEIMLIILTAFLLVALLFIYFKRRTSLRKLRYNDRQKPTEPTDVGEIKKEIYTEIIEKQVIGDWTEQLRIMETRLELTDEMSPVFTVCCDYRREIFDVSSGGYEQLGFDEDKKKIDELTFESLIHADDLRIWDGISECADIKKFKIAANQFVIRLKNSEAESGYRSYFVRVRPLFDDAEQAIALVAGFLDSGYVVEK